MKVLVCGGRAYRDRTHIFGALDHFERQRGEITLLIHGRCLTGADAIARDWAIRRERPDIGEPARWKSQGKAGGPIRNRLMLTRWQPNCVVAFPGGDGTADMCEAAEEAGLRVYRL